MQIRKLTVALLLLCASPLMALNGRSAVSSTGLDTNPCSTTSPCRSFNVAIAATSPGGEVIALDSAGYGPFTVTTPLAISGAAGVHAAISVASGAGITVNAASTDIVLIRNLVIISAGGTSGIADTSAKQLTVTGCLIRGFSTSGVLLDTNGGDLSMQGCTILQNFGYGVVQNAGGAAIHHLLITDCVLHYNNFAIGTQFKGDAVIADSIITDNFNAGVKVDGSGGASVATIKRCTLTGNYHGVETSGGAQGKAYLSQNVIAHNIVGVFNGGTAYSFSNNRLVFNSLDVSINALSSQALQ